MASLFDVARETGLSIATVSKCINGFHVKEENKSKIESAIKKLNYQVNYLAKGLRVGRTVTIGMLLPTFKSLFYPYILSKLERKLNVHGFNILICDYDNDPKLEREKFDLLLSRQVDQIISVPMALTQEDLDRANGRNIPVIFFDHMREGIQNAAVVTNNYEIAYQTVELLLGHSRRHPVMVATSGGGLYATRERLRGCMDCLTRHGFSEGDYVLCATSGDSTDAYQRMKALLQSDRSVDAVFALSSNNMLGSVMALSEMGCRISEDVSFVGFDNSDVSKIYHPVLSYIEQPKDAIADTLVRLVLEREKLLAERTNGVDLKFGSEVIVLDSTLIRTESI